MVDKSRYRWGISIPRNLKIRYDEFITKLIEILDCKIRFVNFMSISIDIQGTELNFLTFIQDKSNQQCFVWSASLNQPNTTTMTTLCLQAHYKKQMKARHAFPSLHREQFHSPLIDRTTIYFVHSSKMAHPQQIENPSKYHHGEHKHLMATWGAAFFLCLYQHLSHLIC